MKKHSVIFPEVLKGISFSFVVTVFLSSFLVLGWLYFADYNDFKWLSRLDNIVIGWIEAGVLATGLLTALSITSILFFQSLKNLTLTSLVAFGLMITLPIGFFLQAQMYGLGFNDDFSGGLTFANGICIFLGTYFYMKGLKNGIEKMDQSEEPVYKDPNIQEIDADDYLKF